MEENNKITKRVVKRVVTKPEETTSSGGSDTFFRILDVVMFLMVFIIFVRGFNIKSTVRDEATATRKQFIEVIEKLNVNLENNRQIDKNEILSAFALYSRLDATSLKEREDYHKQQQAKYENIATQYHQSLNTLTNVIKNKKDSVK
jgi:hypothetical protein